MTARRSVSASYCWIAAIVAVSCLVAGCQKRRGPDFSVLNLADVTGTVTMDGEPLANAYVEFEETETNSRRTCYAITNEKGWYKAIRSSRAPGCLPGRMVVRITSYRGGEDEEESAEPETRIPAKYNRKSELFVDVEPNGTHEFDFPLTSN